MRLNLKLLSTPNIISLSDSKIKTIPFESYFNVTKVHLDPIYDFSIKEFEELIKAIKEKEYRLEQIIDSISNTYYDVNSLDELYDAIQTQMGGETRGDIINYLLQFDDLDIDDEEDLSKVIGVVWAGAGKYVVCQDWNDNIVIWPIYYLLEQLSNDADYFRLRDAKGIENDMSWVNGKQGEVPACFIIYHRGSVSNFIEVRDGEMGNTTDDIYTLLKDDIKEYLSEVYQYSINLEPIRQIPIPQLLVDMMEVMERYNEFRREPFTYRFSTDDLMTWHNERCDSDFEYNIESKKWDNVIKEIKAGFNHITLICKAIVYAIKSKDIKIAIQLLDLSNNDIDINSDVYKDNSLFYYALKSKSSDLVKWFLDHKVEVTEEDKDWIEENYSDLDKDLQKLLYIYVERSDELFKNK